MNYRKSFFTVCLAALSLLTRANDTFVYRTYGDMSCVDLHLPDGFGTTHFIIGFPHELFGSAQKNSKKSSDKASATQEVEKSVQKKRGQQKKQTCAAAVDLNKKAFFAPDDDVQKALIGFINQEQRALSVAIFTFTDNDIAQALIDAHKRGVNIALVTDPAQISDRYSKVSMLAKAGICVYEYNPDYIDDKRSNLMHHKFVVFGTLESQEPFVWTGSFNFTQAACKRNQENAVVVKDKEVVAQFLRQFDLLKKRCVWCRKNQK